MENPTSGLVPLGKIGMWIMLLEEGWSTKLIFARFTSMRIIFMGCGAGQWRQHRYINSDFKWKWRWWAGRAWTGIPVSPSGEINVRRQHKDSTDSYQVLWREAPDPRREIRNGGIRPLIGLIGKVGCVAGEGLVDQVNICLIHLQEMMYFVRLY